MSSESPSSFKAMKKVDDRLKAVLHDAANRKQRSLILLVGDRGKDQIVNLHQMISRANHSAKVNVLWCLREDPDFGSTGKKKQERRARLEVKGGLATEATKEAFQLFLAQNNIRFCKYKESHKILGQTFGMAVLQDFEAISPNVLARTVETVKGGGAVVIMFRSMRNLKQLYTIAMDVHARYRSGTQEIIPRFNERFLLSLMNCDTAMCIDDDLNVLPITQKMKTYGKEAGGAHDHSLALQGQLKHEAELASLKDKLGSTAVGPLVHLCQTVDQAKVVLSLMQAVAEKALDSTCVVTAGRGRGKSAALGIAAAGAVAQGYSNIFCTAPSPENLQTFFEFAVRGLQESGYKERVDFEVLQGSTEEFSKLIIRINIFREHRQTIQFVSATDEEQFSQAELAIIDEAAALPLTRVKKMLGSYLVFLSSTVSGYEGTGRSLSHKLIADMRQRISSGESSRSLKEMDMTEPIRYAPNDPIERWLNSLLCLDATADASPIASAPHPNACELFYVDRDALFSYHPLAEQLLQRIQSLLAAAHYKNQPNDLQLLSDAPGHHLFVLCSSSIEQSRSSLEEVPDIFCVIHACEEGRISPDAVKNFLSHGMRPPGDLIPFSLSQFFIEDSFANLFGLRIVRIATHPELQRGGYGSRAISLLQKYYNGEIALSKAKPTSRKSERRSSAEDDESDMLEPRKIESNILVSLNNRPYEALDYLGVSYGMTIDLFNFWKRAEFDVVYVRQAANELTSEHSCVMIRPFGIDISPLRVEFSRRFIRLLSMPFRLLPTVVALSVLQSVEVHDPHKFAAAVSTTSNGVCTVGGIPQLTSQELNTLFLPQELKRLSLFSSSFVEGSNILDLVPRVAELYFAQKLFRLPGGGEGVVLSHAQAAVLLAVGLQCQTTEMVATQEAFHGVPEAQLRSFFRKAVIRIIEHFQSLSQTESAQDGETTREIYDADGKLVGLSVQTVSRPAVEADTTLLRDTKRVVMGNANTSAKSLQEVFYRPKKVSRHK